MNKSAHLITSLVIAAASLATVAGAQAQSTMSGSDSDTAMSNSNGGTGMSRMSNGYGMYAPGSGYIGFNIGQTDYSLGNGIGIFDSDRHDTAYNIYAGSFFNKNFGLELGYTDFGSVNRAGGNTKADGINLSLVGKLPLGESFNLLGKLGTTYGRTEVSSRPGTGIPTGTERGWGVSYGIGAEYMFTPQWSAVLQYDEHDLNFAGGSRERVNVTSIGARYRF